MKEFDSIIKALREVRKQADALSNHEYIYLCADYYCECFYVFEDSWDLSEFMEKEFSENFPDITPEDYADEWRVWEYSLSQNKSEFPRSFADAKETIFKSKSPLIRRETKVYPEYFVSFHIS